VVRFLPGDLRRYVGDDEGLGKRERGGAKKRKSRGGAPGGGGEWERVAGACSDA